MSEVNTIRTVTNLSRRELFDSVFWTPRENSLLIVISEPEKPPVLTPEIAKIFTESAEFKFWDITAPFQDEYSDYIYQAPSESVLKPIYELLTKKEWEHVYVACAAGISRSGACALFCSDFLNYRWERNRMRAIPNTLIYKTLRKFHSQ